MGKKRAYEVVSELYDGYQALGGTFFDEEDADPLIEAYLSGWADAVHHAGWAAERKPLKWKKAFPLLSPDPFRKQARKALQKRRESH